MRLTTDGTNTTDVVEAFAAANPCVCARRGEHRYTKANPLGTAELQQADHGQVCCPQIQIF
jgi:hypothetical protein